MNAIYKTTRPAKFHSEKDVKITGKFTFKYMDFNEREGIRRSIIGEQIERFKQQGTQV